MLKNLRRMMEKLILSERQIRCFRNGTASKFLKPIKGTEDWGSALFSSGFYTNEAQEIVFQAQALTGSEINIKRTYPYGSFGNIVSVFDKAGNQVNFKLKLGRVIPLPITTLLITDFRHLGFRCEPTLALEQTYREMTEGFNETLVARMYNVWVWCTDVEVIRENSATKKRPYSEILGVYF
jgi:hypothetical protein